MNRFCLESGQRYRRRKQAGQMRRTVGTVMVVTGQGSCLITLNSVVCHRPTTIHYRYSSRTIHRIHTGMAAPRPCHIGHQQGGKDQLDDQTAFQHGIPGAGIRGRDPLLRAPAICNANETITSLSTLTINVHLQRGRQRHNWRPGSSGISRHWRYHPTPGKWDRRNCHRSRSSWWHSS